MTQRLSFHTSTTCITTLLAFYAFLMLLDGDYSSGSRALFDVMFLNFISHLPSCAILGLLRAFMQRTIISS